MSLISFNFLPGYSLFQNENPNTACQDMEHQVDKEIKMLFLYLKKKETMKY